VQEVIQKVKAGAFTLLDSTSIQVGDLILSGNEVEVGFSGKEGLAVESGAGFVIALDTEITPQLALEGKARDLVRAIQDLRKDADLHMADRIVLQVIGADDVLQEHGEYVKGETLCVEIASSLEASEAAKTVDIEGSSVTVKLAKKG
jgi:isoleucyl-tRNA synthetase